MDWLPWPLIPKHLWPEVRFKPKRAITLEEHQLIIQRKKNPEWRNFYELCWHLGGAQSNIANLKTEDVDWPIVSLPPTARAGDRTTEFKQRYVGLGIKGVSLHSYRYAWAERAKQCGYRNQVTNSIATFEFSPIRD